jgi:hypothetical protein
MLNALALPFLTATDPKMAQEGALDPLGLSAVGDFLADLIMPGFRARMARPRFLTALAASAVVCEGLEDEQTRDGTPAFLVLEWLIVEAFVRRASGADIARTPGTHKARVAKETGEAMSARAYLKVPTIFGFHGVYKPLAKHLHVVDDDLGLGEAAHTLIRAWEKDRGDLGFSNRAGESKGDGGLCAQLRHAVRKNLAAGYTTQASGWSGWAAIAGNFAPGNLGRAESEALWKLLLSEEFPQRAEIMRRLKGRKDRSMPESSVVTEWLIPFVNGELRDRLQAVAAFERLAGMLERAFNSIRVSSTLRQGPVTAGDLAKDRALVDVAKSFGRAKSAADEAIAKVGGAPLLAFERLLRSFDGVRSEEALFEALIERHKSVQASKKPNGKRPWFETDDTGRAFVRIPYRLKAMPEMPGWERPYRIDAARSFIRDLTAGARG